MEGHSGGISVAILGPDRIVSGSTTIPKIWNTDGECLKTLEGHSGGVYSVAILGPDRIVSGSSDETVRYGIRMAVLKTLEGHSGGVYSVAILGPDRSLADHRTIPKIWNTDGECLKTLKATVVV